MSNTPSRLEIAEYLVLAVALIGMIVAGVSGWMALATIPLLLALLLNLVNRQQLEQRIKRSDRLAVSRTRQQLSEEMAALQQQIESLNKAVVPADVKDPTVVTPNSAAGSDLAGIQQQIAELQDQQAALQESLTSAIHYLNNLSLPARVAQLEKGIANLQQRGVALPQISELQDQVSALQQTLQSTNVTTQTDSSETLPEEALRGGEPQGSSNSTPTAKSATTSPVLPQFLTNATPQKWRCLKTWVAHTDWVRSLVISPDSQLLASGSFDSTIKIWHLPTGELLHTLTDHLRGIFSLAISPDGKMLASGSWDETIKLWDLNTGTLLDTLTGHLGSVRAIALSPDGQTLVSGSFDETIKLWRLHSVQRLGSLSDSAGQVYAIAFSPNGQLLASGSGDGLIRFWQLNVDEYGLLSGSLVRRIPASLDFIWSIDFSPDDQMLVSGSGDGTLKLWQVVTGELMGTLIAHTGPVYAVAHAPQLPKHQDGSSFASASADGTIKIWHLPSRKQVATLSHESGSAVISLAYAPVLTAYPESQILVSGSADGEIAIWQRDFATP